MARTERSGHTTVDHEFIRGWVEERGGWPARVVGTGGDGGPGLIRVDFPGFSGEGSLERIEWEEWFRGFEANGLAFLHRDIDHGGNDLDRFNKLIRRDGSEEEGEGGGGARKRSAGASTGGTRSASASKASSARGGAKKSAARESASASSGGSRGRAAAEKGAAKDEASSSARGRAGSSGGGEAGEGGAELRELLMHSLGDLLSAERVFLQGTRALAREAMDPAVKARTEAHVGETEGQIERLKEAFAAVGERAKAVKCEAAVGLKEEHDSFKSEEKPSKLLLSAFGLGSGLRVEHYEIAAYRSTIAVAEALGERECARLLKENLQEEMAMASFLEKSSRTVLKNVASGGMAAAAPKKAGAAKKAAPAKRAAPAKKAAAPKKGPAKKRG